MPIEYLYRPYSLFYPCWKHDRITKILIDTNTAIPGEQGKKAPEGPEKTAQKCRPRIHHRRSRRRSIRYRDLRTDWSNFWIQSTVARLVHLPVHDCHPADVQPDRDGDGERADWSHPRALLEAGAVHNGLIARDCEHDQHRRRSRSDGLLGSDAAGAA